MRKPSLLQNTSEFLDTASGGPGLSFGNRVALGVQPAGPEDAIRAISRLQLELVEYQRLALLGSIAGMIAHEFSNLMTPVLARAQDALTHQEIPNMQRALQTTVSRTQTAITIARQLLVLAHGARMTTESCSVAEAVHATIQLSGRPPDRSNIELQVEVPDELRVWAVPLLLQQVFLNLVLNARNSMEGRTGRLRITAQREAGQVVVEFCDNGRGIDAARLRDVINPFLNADPQVDPSDWQSVGMGLNVCRTIVGLHGGRIQASADERQGCRFRVYWPSADGNIETPPAIGRPASCDA